MAQLEVPQVAAWGEANKPRAQEILQFMDEELGKRRFIAGDDYSVADITALVAVDFARPARMQRPEGLKNLARWHAGGLGPAEREGLSCCRRRLLPVT